MALVDVSALPDTIRLQAADRIRALRDFALPPLHWFNSDPCAAHESIAEGAAQIPPCRRCGIAFRRHQRVGVAWLFMRGYGLIADQVGTGKTAQAAGLIAACKQIGELDRQRAIVVVRPSVLPQWTAELGRFLPRLTTMSYTGTRTERVNRLLAPWDINVTGFPIFTRDVDTFDALPVGVLIVDDIDALRNPANQTAYAIKRIARKSPRVIVLTGTPLQKKLEELHSVTEPLGGLSIFGPESAFRRAYVREERVRLYSPGAGRMITTRKATGYRNLDDFIAKLTPMVLRRTPTDIDDVDLPAVIPNTVYLDLTPAQRARYSELREGVVRLIREHGAEVKHTEAAAKFLYGAQICAGLATLGEPDRPGSSAKLDWIEHALVDGDLSDEPKTVVFGQFTNTIAALRDRLTLARVGTVVIWGRDTRKAARAEAVNRFWDDPSCRVLLGTSAIEQGLNLQVARHLINIDQIMNPARMQQLAGRIRRDGSAYRSVYVHNLLCRDTQEEGYLDLLAREQALADHIWNEENALFDRLSPLALLQLIGSSGRRRR